MKLTPINGNTETEGSVFVYMGAKFLVARANNVNFDNIFRRLMKPFESEFEAGRMNVGDSDELMIECTAKTILVGWETFKDTDGNDVEYNVDNSISLLTDDKDVYNAVTGFSKNIDNYLIDDRRKLQEK